jgi:hypothetical protein
MEVITIMSNIQTQTPVEEHNKLRIEPFRSEREEDYIELDSLIFGDNQFFGINHMSNEKAQSQAIRFKDSEAIIKVIDNAYQAGIHAFMFNTHDRVGEICDHFRAHPDRYSDLRLYPSLPYAHKYANAVNESGMLGALNEFIFSGRSTRQAISTIIQGGKSIIKKDMIEVMKMLVDAEMRMFRGLRIKAIFLQNIITDLLLGLDVKDVFIEFANHVKKKYGVEAAFNTANMPVLVDFLLDCGIENPIVCASINKVGFAMNPNQAQCEKALAEKPFRPIAMAIFASGAVPPKEAIEYICNLPNIRTIIFGASSREHIVNTMNMIYSCRKQKP